MSTCARYAYYYDCIEGVPCQSLTLRYRRNYNKSAPKSERRYVVSFAATYHLAIAHNHVIVVSSERHGSNLGQQLARPHKDVFQIQRQQM